MHMLFVSETSSSLVGTFNLITVGDRHPYPSPVWTVGLIVEKKLDWANDTRNKMFSQDVTAAMFTNQ